MVRRSDPVCSLVRGGCAAVCRWLVVYRPCRPSSLSRAVWGRRARRWYSLAGHSGGRPGMVARLAWCLPWPHHCPHVAHHMWHLSTRLLWEYTPSPEPSRVRSVRASEGGEPLPQQGWGGRQKEADGKQRRGKREGPRVPGRMSGAFMQASQGHGWGQKMKGARWYLQVCTYLRRSLGGRDSSSTVTRRGF